MQPRASPTRALLASFALCAVLAACAEQSDAAPGPRGTALPPPGLDPAADAAASTPTPASAGAPTGREGSVTPPRDARPLPATRAARPRPG